MAGDELARKGWHLTEQGLQECMEDGNKRTDVIVKNALDTDLREIGAKWLPEELQRGKLDYIQGPTVLQITKMKNIAAPKENEESQGAPRMMKIILTDGQTNCTAVETEILKNMGFNTPPGSKIFIDGTVEVECNILLLNNKNTRFIGGHVEKLAENWQLKKSLKYQTRSNVRSEGGPPAYVPFGQKNTSQLPNPRKENFKSFDTNKEKSSGDKNEFQQQRQATIAEALQAKDSKAKTFGGGGKLALEDNDIAKIVDMGFSTEDATNALRFSNGNVSDAIHSLLSKGNNSRGRPRQDKHERPSERVDRTDRKEKPSSRPRRGGNPTNTEESSANSQPSGPSTLFDFLTNKIPVKEETKPSSSTSNYKSQSRFVAEHNENKTNQPSQSTNSYDNKSNPNRTNRSNPHYEASSSNHPDNKSHSSYDNHNYNNRRQNVPPRFAQKYGKDAADGHYNSGMSNSSNSDSDNFDRTRHKRQENYRNDYNGSSRDSNYRSQNKYSQDSRKSDNYDPPPNRSGASSRPIENKKYNDYSKTKSADVKYSQAGGIKSQSDRLVNSQVQNNRSTATTTSSSKWETRNDLAGWNKGDMCLAKYWEDKQFYPAVIEAIAQNGSTCVVTFPDYGNQEEVFCTDMMPMPNQNWTDGVQSMNQVTFTAPPPFYPNQMPVCPPYQPDPYMAAGHFTMEFRRGGNGPQYNRKQDKGRPTQQFYQPPSNKSYQ
ncbi:tudor domain-containing protein 3 isoform X1 [Patella vulgata]|uniref:tudor domain-containing protein 3 isoform X1 n=2 Tax=Patella vulgata TaxID=6465 RepID=UPI00218065BF|nr:tudor domain-containing protein 3 isoform X1 [Patella vulgata]